MLQLRTRTWTFRSLYHWFPFVLLGATKLVYIWTTIRRYERDSTGGFLIQFWMVLSCLPTKSKAQWYGKTRSIRTMGVFTLQKAILIQSAPIHKHTCFPQAELNLKHIFFLLMETWNYRSYICLANIMSSVYLWDNSINTQNRAVIFWDSPGLKWHVDA